MHSLAHSLASAKSVEKEGVDYEITLRACQDNKHISDDVPTAPWH